MPRIAPTILLDPETRATLNSWVQAPSTAQALVLRRRIILAAAADLANRKIAADLKVPQVTVGKWRRSFAEHGLDGLRDAPRSGRPPKHDASVWQKVQTLVCQQPESQGRWSVRTLARKVGLPHSTVHAMLNASELQPHRIRTFTFSPDPEFEPKLLDIVGLYLNPPEKGRTSVNFLRFMNDVVRAYPHRELHVVVDNLNIHKNEAARRWLGRHKQVHFHYTPTHASWVNLIECFFSILSKQGLAHSVQHSKQDLKDLLHRFLDSYNQTCNPFTWTKGPEHLQRIIETTKEYQALHPKKPRRRAKRKPADSTRN